MKRLIFATGKWSTILTIAYLRSREDAPEYEDTLVHMSHSCDQAYLDSFNKFCGDFWDFAKIECINYCVYEDATIEGYTFGDLREKPDDLCASLLRDLLGSQQFDEIIVPHLFSPKSRLFMQMYESASVYCIEEGLNSYFRHYSKTNLGEKDVYFLSRLQGYISYNFLGLEPLFDLETHDVPIIVPPSHFVKDVIDTISDQGLEIPSPESPDKVLFIGQVARADMSVDQLLEHYIASISSLLVNGATVYYLKHPRDQSDIATLLSEVFSGASFHVIDAKDVPAEKIAAKYDWTMVTSYASSALITIPALYDIPGFTIDEYKLDDLQPGAGDFVNARNFCAVVTPTLRSLLTVLDSDRLSFSDAVASAHSQFLPDPGRVRGIYKKKPVKKNYSTYLKLKTADIEREISRAPYNSRLWLAYAKKQNSYKKSVRAAWRGLLLNITSPLNQEVFLDVLTKPARLWFKPKIIHNEADIRKAAAIAPLSKQALFSQAQLHEGRGEWKSALRFRLVSLLAHPIAPLSYYYLYRWWSKQRDKKMLAKKSGPSFTRRWEKAIKSLEAKAASVAHKHSTTIEPGILALTYRPDRGMTGGPGGVLALQKAIVGPYFRDYRIEYLFRDKVQRKDLYSDLISGADFALDACSSGKHTHFVVHDLGTAYGLALAGKPFAIVWHFQGSFVTQMLNFGHRLPEPFIAELKRIERFALEKAKFVVFPSDGARDMYLSDEFRGASADKITLSESVYNTILPPSTPQPLTSASDIPKFDGLTFTSVGTLTTAKGQDQVLDFFDRILPYTAKKIRWICIGSGTMKEELLQTANRLLSKHPNFSFTYLPKVPHPDVMNILSKSDVYIMLHRISIFDFATLEAMKNNCAIMLSKIGGNLDFERAGNVIFVEPDVPFDVDLLNDDKISHLKKMSRQVLDDHFSPLNFKRSSIRMLERLTAH